MLIFSFGTLIVSHSFGTSGVNKSPFRSVQKEFGYRVDSKYGGLWLFIYMAKGSSFHNGGRL